MFNTPANLLIVGCAALFQATGAAHADAAGDAMKALEKLLDDGVVMKCGDIKMFKLPDGKVSMNKEGPVKITADSNYVYLDGKLIHPH